MSVPVDNAGSLSERKPTPLPTNPDTAVRNWAAVDASIAADRVAGLDELEALAKAWTLRGAVRAVVGEHLLSAR